ncbi:hypothetical protein HN031_05655 [Nocardioides sp. zg-1308]|uniref:LuxR C-terminal-related transcriptional regulator n=1 Tax=Nocardioides renjunii TaxID=3095075 RepID=A0ABU5K7W4_9ACTN|nr:MULTISPECIES: helix-turn-helix transcriptional regulator [unclassified Nocardioides]MDZ5661050.1 LuxR C-terminal-related transcriptional regulator [Nocardioides sp. S-58]NPD04168.1 hypothetical protein [Nocardioides sp. zg-1308]WQQ22053.1 LuxR C-terminal-related transcriptional regulator [Nocardioides sp. S-34]
MPDLVLNDVQQQALRDLLGSDPCPGSPLPPRKVLESIAVLLPADEIGVAYQDRPHRAIEGILRPGDGLVVSFRNGVDGMVQFTLRRRDRSPFAERDVAVLRMITPVLARLVRERPTPTLPSALTTQERRVLSRVAAGQSNAQIAAGLFIAPSTVRKHLEHVYRKLGVTSRVAAVARLQGRDAPGIDLRERLARLG